MDPIQLHILSALPLALVETVIGIVGLWVSLMLLIKHWGQRSQK